MAHLQKLAGEIGVRAAGTEGEDRAAEYIRSELASYGYEATLQPFPIETYLDVDTTLDVVAPDAPDIAAQALAGSVSGDAEGLVVLAGIGRPEEFPTGSAGSIALVQRGELFFSEKAQNARDAGAAGVIIYNNQPGSFGGQVRDSIDIPAVTISREDGEALQALLAAGPVTARVSVQGRNISGDSQNVIARPPGGDCRVIVGGHYDSVPDGPGANDNASGTSVAIEMARVLAADGALDDVCFALFGAEEIGLVGSGYYVNSLPAADKGAILAMLNFDMLAVGEGWPLVGTTSVVSLAGEAAEAAGIPYTISSDPPGIGSDHASFVAEDVPVLMFNCFCDPNYHTAADRVEFIQRERVEQAGIVGLGVIERLLAAAGG